MIEPRVRSRVRDETLPFDARWRLLVGRRHDRPEREREVARLRTVELGSDPFHHRRKAADPAVGVDDGSDATYRNDVLRADRSVDDVVRREDGRRVRKHEVTRLVEEPYRRRMEHRRPERDLVQRIRCVLPREAAAAEERLQRLRRQLHDDVAVDPSRPAALEREIRRREHAELHSPGSVCTTTSATSGNRRRMRSSISLARACAAASA